jgi:hypothetical protein
VLWVGSGFILKSGWLERPTESKVLSRRSLLD